MNPGTLNKIAIIGVYGQMGGSLARAFRDAGRTVAGLDRPLEPDALKPALHDCDLMLLCVPVTAFDSVLEKTVPHLPKHAIVADICSVKINPMRAMRRAWEGAVVGTHPLFGPVIPDGFEPRVAVVPGGDDDAAAAVHGLFADAGFSPFASTGEEHDRAMAYIQGLNFTTTAAYLAACGRVEGIEKYVTPSFERRLEAARKMLTQDRELFETIAEANPYLQETSRQFMTWMSLAAGGELDLLSGLAQWWWREQKSGEGVV